MNKKNYDQNKFKNLEQIKWFSIWIYFILLLCTNYFLHEQSLFIRTSITSLLIICIITTLRYTKKGKNIFLYIKMAQKEMQKIMWPNHRETLYTVFIIICVTIVISLILWGLDNIIFHFITFIINLRF